jgi:hypothetical protein
MPLPATRTIGTGEHCDITDGGIYPHDWAELRDMPPGADHRQPGQTTAPDRSVRRRGTVLGRFRAGGLARGRRQRVTCRCAARISMQPRLATHPDRVLHPEDTMPRGGSAAPRRRRRRRSRAIGHRRARRSGRRTSPCTQRWPPSQSRKGDCAFRSASSAPLPPRSSCRRYAARSETSPEQSTIGHAARGEVGLVARGRYCRAAIVRFVGPPPVVWCPVPSLG